MQTILEELNKDNKQFYEKLDMSLKYIVDKYSVYFDSNEQTKESLLVSLDSDLEKLSNLFDNYGYTYEPSFIGDISESAFEEVIMRYMKSFKDYLDDGSSNLETLNVDIKTLLKQVDKHLEKMKHFN